jgi:hypothetical protein
LYTWPVVPTQSCTGIGPPLAGDGLTGLPSHDLIRFADVSAENATRIDEAGIGDVCLDTDGLSGADVVSAVLTDAGCPGFD